MANAKKYRSTTITSYFSAFRLLHLIKGFYKNKLRPDIVSQMLTGLKNGDLMDDIAQKRQTRQPVTVEIMEQ